MLNASNIQNSATTATSDAIVDSIVLRDSVGNFSAGTITANLSGHASADAFLIPNPTPNNLVFTDEFGQSFDRGISVTTSTNFLNATDSELPTASAVKNYVDNLISSTFRIQGNWNAQTNTPELQAGVGELNYAYIITVAGSQSAPSGVLTEYFVGDLLYYGADNIWNQVSQGQSVVSINGLTGVVSNFKTSNLTDVAESNLQNAQVLIYNSTLSQYRNESLSGAITINQTGTASAGDLSGGTGDLSGASIVSESAVQGTILLAGANGLAQSSTVSITTNFDEISEEKVPTTNAIVNYLHDNVSVIQDDFTIGSTFLGPMNINSLSNTLNSTGSQYLKINEKDFYFCINAASFAGQGTPGNTISVYEIQPSSFPCSQPVFVQDLTCGSAPYGVANYFDGVNNYLFVSNSQNNTFSVFLYNGTTFDLFSTLSCGSTPLGISCFNFNAQEYLVACFGGLNQTKVYTFNGSALSEISSISTPSCSNNSFFEFEENLYIGVLSKNANFYTIKFDGASLTLVGSPISTDIRSIQCFTFYKINEIPMLSIANNVTDGDGFPATTNVVSNFIWQNDTVGFVFSEFLNAKAPQYQFSGYSFNDLKSIEINGNLYLVGVTWSYQIICFIYNGSNWSNFGGNVLSGIYGFTSLALINQSDVITFVSNGGPYIYYSVFNEYLKLSTQSLNVPSVSAQTNLVNNYSFKAKPILQVNNYSALNNNHTYAPVSYDEFYVQSVTGNVALNNDIKNTQNIVTSSADVNLNFASPSRTRFTGNVNQRVVLDASNTLQGASTGFNNVGLVLTIVNSSSANVTVAAFNSTTLQVMYPNTICTFTIIDQSVNTQASWEYTYNFLKMSNPVPSSTVTNGFGSTLTVGTALRNNLGYTILVNVNVSYAAAGLGGQLLLGVGGSSTPTTNAVTPVLVTASAFNSFSVAVRSGQYLLLNTNGTVVVSNVTLQATQA